MNGTHLTGGTLKVSKQVNPALAYLTATLTDVVVESYQAGSGGNGQVPVDRVSMVLSKVAAEYRHINPDGTLGAPNTAVYDSQAMVQATPSTAGSATTC